MSIALADIVHLKITIGYCFHLLRNRIVNFLEWIGDSVSVFICVYP